MYEATTETDFMTLNIKKESSISGVLSDLNKVTLLDSQWVIPTSQQQSPNGHIRVTVGLEPIGQLCLSIGPSATSHRLTTIVNSVDTPGMKLNRVEKQLLRTLLKDTDGRIQIYERVHTLHPAEDSDADSSLQLPRIPGVEVTPGGTGLPEPPPTGPIYPIPGDDNANSPQQPGTTNANAEPDSTFITDDFILVAIDMTHRNLQVRREGERTISLMHVDADDWSYGLSKLLPARVRLRYRIAQSAHRDAYIVDGAWFRAGVLKLARTLRKARFLQRFRNLLD